MNEATFTACFGPSIEIDTILNPRSPKIASDAERDSSLKRICSISCFTPSSKGCLECEEIDGIEKLCWLELCTDKAGPYDPDGMETCSE